MIDPRSTRAYKLEKENKELKKEIERLNKQIEEYQKALDETTSEKIDLENIIKEVREYINNHFYMESTGGIQHPTFDGKMNRDTNGFELLEILDKID